MIQIGDMLRMLDPNEQGVSPRNARAKRAFADYLRANQTPSERMFARVLHHLGIGASPQMTICGFIADFLDTDRRVVFEIDGPIHKKRAELDKLRDEILTAAGYRVIRISNDGVRNLMVSLAGLPR